MGQHEYLVCPGNGCYVPGTVAFLLFEVLVAGQKDCVVSFLQLHAHLLFPLLPKSNENTLFMNYDNVLFCKVQLQRRQYVLMTNRLFA